ncbi:MAG: hypothetical protein KGJ80_08120 [Chloroflexota bacterium]|nr:hypothetical protein [Chloroflexota bacterium]
MSNVSDPPAYEWADKAFEGAPDVEPKYRDLLAMLAAAMMGDPGAAQHFYNRAAVDGASAAELQRFADLARAQNVALGDLAAHAKHAADEIRAEREQTVDAENSGERPNSN